MYADDSVDDRLRQTSAAGFNDYETLRQTVAKLTDRVEHGWSHRATRVSWESNQNDASGLQSACVGQQTEVPVLRQEHSRFRLRQSEDDVVVDSGIDFGDCRDVKAGLTQGADETEKSQLSSARNRKGQSRCSEDVEAMKTTSSCASVSAA